jgi:hypothetical protein
VVVVAQAPQELMALVQERQAMAAMDHLHQLLELLLLVQAVAVAVVLQQERVAQAAVEQVLSLLVHLTAQQEL